MGLFSFIETFFFVSLGITILLIALLVYHFKQRVSSLEQRHDAMFELVTNIVKQIRSMQTNIDTMHKTPYENVHLGNISYYTSPETIQSQTIRYGSQPVETVKIVDDINVPTAVYSDDSDSGSDDESEVDIHESDVDSVDSGDSNNDSDNDSDEDSQDIAKYNSTNTMDDNNTQSTESIKIINLLVDEYNKDVISISSDDEVELCEEESDSSSEIELIPIQDDVHDYTQLPIAENEIHHAEPVVVIKIEKNTQPIETPVIVPEKNTLNDLYKKMTLANLKATVISKGLCSDPSKMKKQELLNLLQLVHE